MITRIEATNFRLLKHIQQDVAPFQILVGPNGSGKSTFLDVVNFLGDLVKGGLDEAVSKRSSNFFDLTSGRNGGVIKLALEAEVPEQIRMSMEGAGELVRYEVGFGISENELVIFEECFSTSYPDVGFFPNYRYERGIANLMASETPIINDFMPSFIGGGRSLFSVFPTSREFDWAGGWFRDLLKEGITSISLENRTLALPSPPGKAIFFLQDGGNLPWVLDHFKKNNPAEFFDWLAHLRTALRDLEDISVITRPEDRHKYLMVKYKNGVEIPSWMVSDGSLRLIALTLIAFLPDQNRFYLIEEPENGIHPQAVETVYRALSQAGNAQVWLATHSTVLLNNAEKDELLCFSKGKDGYAQIISGSEHPYLADWRNEVPLGTLFGGGVLG